MKILEIEKMENIQGSQDYSECSVSYTLIPALGFVFIVLPGKIYCP